MKKAKGMWMVPKLWPGGECFILGGGPSLRGFDIEQLKGRRVIAVNNAYKMANWIDVMFFGDCRWWNVHAKNLLNFAGLKVTTCAQHLDKPGIKVIKKRNSPTGISNDRGIVTWNLSSGACAINLAVHFGVKSIVLLGYDMKKDGEAHNWHNDHVNSKNLKRNPYQRFMRNFPAIAESLRRTHIKCVNANPDSALEVFPKVCLEDVL